jgi:hypothetical protein
MKKIVLLLILVAVAWKGYERSKHDPVQTAPVRAQAIELNADVQAAPSISIERSSQSTFACDGRTYCSQMRSCDEAKYFLQHCPNVEMDGDNDGIPCEKQWCS